MWIFLKLQERHSKYLFLFCIYTDGRPDKYEKNDIKEIHKRIYEFQVKVTVPVRVLISKRVFRLK